MTNLIQLCVIFKNTNCNLIHKAGQYKALNLAKRRSLHGTEAVMPKVLQQMEWKAALTHLVDSGEVIEYGLQLVLVNALTLEDQTLDVVQHLLPDLHHLILVRTRAVWIQELNNFIEPVQSIPLAKIKIWLFFRQRSQKRQHQFSSHREDGEAKWIWGWDSGVRSGYCLRELNSSVLCRHRYHCYSVEFTHTHTHTVTYSRLELL